MDDKELIYNVERAMEHDEEAMAALYNYTYAGAYALVSGLCRDEAAIEDILQESYLAAFSSLKNLNNKANFWHWFRGIILNKWRDYSKNKLFAHNMVLYDFAESTLDNEKLEPSAYDVVEKAQINDEVWNLVNNLPDNQRVCVILFYYENMKIDEIADVLDIPAGSVKSRLHYARERLKKQLKQKELFAAYPITIMGSAAQKSEILGKVLTSLTEAAEGSVSPVVKTLGSGLLLKLGVSFASILAVGGIMAAAIDLSKTPDLTPSAFEPVTAAVIKHETTAATTTITSTTETTTATSSVPTTTTTTAPQKFVSFDYQNVGGGVAITKYKGNEANVDIPSQIDGKPVVKIAANAFNSCRVLRSVTIPNSVTEVGDNAFRECLFLSSISLGGGVRHIGDMAFGGCDSLRQIYIPSSVRYVGIYAFAYCDLLESVTIAEGTQTLMYCAFYQCPSLRRVELPATLTAMGTEAFAGTSSSLVICVKDGTYAQQYAIENGYNTELYN